MVRYHYVDVLFSQKEGQFYAVMHARIIVEARVKRSVASIC